MRGSALPAFHSTSLAQASAAVAEAMRRLCNDVAAGRAAGRGADTAAIADDQDGGATPAGQPFNLIPLAQRAAMAAAFERTFGIPFPESVRPRAPPPHMHASIAWLPTTTMEFPH